MYVLRLEVSTEDIDTRLKADLIAKTPYREQSVPYGAGAVG